MSQSGFQAIIDAQAHVGTDALATVLTVPAGMVIPIGSTIVVATGMLTTGATFTLTDTHSQTWLNPLYANGSGNTNVGSLFTANTTAVFVGGDTITLTPSVSTSGKCGIAGWFAGINAIDAATEGTNTSTASPTTLVLTGAGTAAESLVCNVSFIVVTADKTASLAPSAGWTLVGSVAHASGTIKTVALFVQTGTQGGIPSNSPTWTTGNNCAGGIASFPITQFADIPRGDTFPTGYLDGILLDGPNRGPIDDFIETRNFLALSPGTVYTDAGTALLAITASGVNTLQAVDAGTALPIILPSDTDVAVRADVGTATVALTASGTDTLQTVDAGTALVSTTPSGVEQRTPAANPDVRDNYPLSSMPGPFQGPQGYFQEQRTIYQYVVEPATTALVTITASGVEQDIHTDVGTSTVALVASGTDALIHTDAGTALVSMQPQMLAEAFQAANPNISYQQGYPLTSKPGPFLGPVGFFQEQRAVNQLIVEPTTQALVTITASGTDTAQRVDAGTATVGLVASGVDSAVRADVGTALVSTTPSGTDVNTSLVVPQIPYQDGYPHQLKTGPFAGPAGFFQENRFVNTTSPPQVYSDSSIGGWGADVASQSGAGTDTQIVATFNQDIPVGTLLMVNVCSSTAAPSTVNDAAGNTYSVYFNAAIGGTTQIHHAVFTCYTTLPISSGDALTNVYATSCNGRAITVSAYNGVVAATPLDTAAGTHAVASTGLTNSLSMTAAAAGVQSYEQIYIAYALAVDVTNPVFDSTYAKRTQATSTGAVRTVATLDKSTYTSTTPTVNLTWDTGGHASGIFIPLRLSTLPSITSITAGGTEPTQPADAAVCQVGIIPSGAAPEQSIDAGKALPVFQPSGTDAYNLRAPDTGTSTFSLDATNSTETFVRLDAATCLLKTSQPFRQDIVQYRDTGIATVRLVLTDKSPQLGKFDSCLHTTVSPRWTPAPVGARYTAKGFVRYVASAHKRWGTINVGKCP